MQTHHVFILNPAAGPSDQTAELRTLIDTTCRKENLSYTVLSTLHKGQATELCRTYALDHPDVTCRFYSCGGDGTLNEVITGVINCDNAEVACFSCGTGNDFIKIFENTDAFHDLTRVVSGSVASLDAMHVETDGDASHGAINICSVGVDARVADWASRNKRRLPFSGKLVYDLAVLKVFFSRLYRKYKVTIDGVSYDGEYTIIVAASGRFYGGGYYVVPESEPDDGLLDFLLVRRVTHLQLINLIGKYQQGRHTELGDVAVHLRGKEMILETENDEALNFDGEIVPGRRMQITVKEGGIPFVVPKGSKIIHGAKAFASKIKEKQVKTSKPGKKLV